MTNSPESRGPERTVALSSARSSEAAVVWLRLRGVVSARLRRLGLRSLRRELTRTPECERRCAPCAQNQH